MREINTIFTMSLNHRVLYIVSSLSFDNNPYQLRKMKKKKRRKNIGGVWARCFSGASFFRLSSIFIYFKCVLVALNTEELQINVTTTIL